MVKKYDVQLAVAATQAKGTQSVESPQVLAQHHLAFMVSAVPAAGSLAVYGRTPGAQQWSLIMTIDMTKGAQLLPFMGVFDQFRCIPTGFDAGKQYWVTITTSDIGMFSNGTPTPLTRSTIATGIIATKNININGHVLIPQHQLQIDITGTAAGSATVFGKPINGGLVPLGTISFTSGPQHILFRGFFDGLQIVPSGIGAAKLNVYLVSAEDGLVGPSAEMMMPMSTGLLQPYSRAAMVWSSSLGMFVPVNAAVRGAAYFLDANQNVASVGGGGIAISWDLAGRIYDTDNIWQSGNPTRFLVPPGVSWVKLAGNLCFNNNATGIRFILFHKNGSRPTGTHALVVNNNGAGATTQVGIGETPPIQVVGGTDYFELMAGQNSGGALAVLADSNGASTFFGMEILY